MPASAPVLLPGDFEVCKIAGVGGAAISFAQWLGGADRWTTWDHARGYLGKGLWLQAEPAGAEVIYRGDRATPGGMCSAGIARLSLTAAQRDEALPTGRSLEHTPYSWLDYAAIALHSRHIPAPHLQAYIKDSGHAQCAQLIDLWRLRLDSHLFDDGRWEGFVDPWDLGHLLAGYGAQPTP